MVVTHISMSEDTHWHCQQLWNALGRDKPHSQIFFLKRSDMNQKTWLPRQPFHKVIVWIFHNESCASFTDSVVPAIDGFQRCVSLLQAFFQLQNDETTKKCCPCHIVNLQKLYT